VTALAATLATLALLLVAASAAADGSAIYRERCAVCHGAEGRGDGPAGGLLAPPPRDFTTGRYKFRSTPNGTLPTDADLARSIGEGLPGSSMPAWSTLLSNDDTHHWIARIADGNFTVSVCPFASVIGPQLIIFTKELWQPYLFAGTYLAQAALAALGPP
jgi:mono/diheme cytochrome c family protein